nr:UvrD-helicase domain-containing protein [Bacteroidota bacterium]
MMNSVPGQLTIYKSSAGSGKTFTLVKEYLKLCLPKPDKFRRITALTFTKAAAAEMKQRILDKLKGLAENREEHLKGILLKEGLTESEVGNASRLLENILYNYSLFSVGTLDSFFKRILTSFSKELNIPMDVGVELDTEKVWEYAVDAFLSNAYQNATAQGILKEYIREKIDSGSSWRIRQDLINMAKEMSKNPIESTDGFSYEDIKEFTRMLRDSIRQFESEMAALGQSAQKLIEVNGFALDDFKGKSRGPAMYFDKIQKNKKGGTLNYTPSATFENAITNSSGWITMGMSRAEEATTFVENFLLPASNNVFTYF